MLGAVGSQLGALQLGQIFVLGDVPDVPDLDLCCTSVESLTPVRRTVDLNPDRTSESLGPVRRTKVVCS